MKVKRNSQEQCRSIELFRFFLHLVYQKITSIYVGFRITPQLIIYDRHHKKSS